MSKDQVMAIWEFRGGGARGTINMLMVMFKMVTVELSLEKLLRENIAGLACKRAVPVRIEVKILLEHENSHSTLKVGSCPNDDNFVQVFFLSFLCSI